MATFELKMPKLGESVTEGTIGKWLKQPGEKVAKYDLLVEVQTDKVNTEIPSPVEGTLKDIKVKEGETVPIGALLAIFETGDGGAAAEATSGRPAQPVARPADSPAPSPAPVASPSAPAQMPVERPPAPPATAGAPLERPSTPPITAAAPAARSSDGETRATPAVRKLAAEHGIDLSQVEGTGLGGRVSKADVERFIAGGAAGVPASAPAAPATAARAAPPMPAPMTGDELVPLTQMRKAIANAMVTSKTTIPHAAAMVEVDWTNVARFRDGVKAEFKAREGFELTYLPFAIKAVCLALRRNQLVNAAWTEKGVLKLKAINIGIAISLGDEGLVVPVIKNADELSITGLARAVRDLATRARAKKLTIPDFEGGTFTVNNGGTLGTYLSYPIVNPPQAAIMTTEAIGKRVVVSGDDAIAIRMMGFLVMSFDHRVMDGATAARFLGDVKAWLQSVDAANVSLG